MSSTFFLFRSSCVCWLLLPVQLLALLIPSLTRTPLKPLFERNIYHDVGDVRGTYRDLIIPTQPGINFIDITEQVKDVVNRAGVNTGIVTVMSCHTTAAITINEMEPRLIDDTRQFLLKLVPAAYPYLHNDLHLRSGPKDWPGGDEAWRAQEPVNAHRYG